MNPKRLELCEKLTEGLVIREHQAQCPEMTVDMYEKARSKYLHDNIFHARVEQLVAGIMHLVDQYVEFPEEDK